MPNQIQIDLKALKLVKGDEVRYALVIESKALIGLTPWPEEFTEDDTEALDRLEMTTTQNLHDMISGLLKWAEQFNDIGYMNLPEQLLDLLDIEQEDEEKEDNE